MDDNRIPDVWFCSKFQNGNNVRTQVAEKEFFENAVCDKIVHIEAVSAALLNVDTRKSNTLSRKSFAKPKRKSSILSPKSSLKLKYLNNVLHRVIKPKQSRSEKVMETLDEYMSVKIDDFENLVDVWENMVQFLTNEEIVVANPASSAEAVVESLKRTDTEMDEVTKTHTHEEKETIKSGQSDNFQQQSTPVLKSSKNESRRTSESNQKIETPAAHVPLSNKEPKTKLYNDEINVSINLNLTVQKETNKRGIDDDSISILITRQTNDETVGGGSREPFSEEKCRDPVSIPSQDNMDKQNIAFSNAKENDTPAVPTSLYLCEETKDDCTVKSSEWIKNDFTATNNVSDVNIGGNKTETEVMDATGECHKKFEPYLRRCEEIKDDFKTTEQNDNQPKPMTDVSEYVSPVLGEQISPYLLPRRGNIQSEYVNPNLASPAPCDSTIYEFPELVSAKFRSDNDETRSFGKDLFKMWRSQVQIDLNPYETPNTQFPSQSSRCSRSNAFNPVESFGVDSFFLSANKDENESIIYRNIPWQSNSSVVLKSCASLQLTPIKEGYGYYQMLQRPVECGDKEERRIPIVRFEKVNVATIVQDESTQTDDQTQEIVRKNDGIVAEQAQARRFTFGTLFSALKDRVW